MSREDSWGWSTANPTITKLEAAGYTVEQAEEIAGVACSTAQASGIPMDEATQAICSVIRTLSPPGNAEIAMIRLNPSLNIFQKWWLIHKIKKQRKMWYRGRRYGRRER